MRYGKEKVPLNPLLYEVPGVLETLPLVKGIFVEVF